MRNVSHEWGHHEGKMPRQHYSKEDEQIGDGESEETMLNTVRYVVRKTTDFLYRINFMKFRGFRGICKPTDVMLYQSQTGEKEVSKLTWKGGRADTVCTRGDDINFAVRERSLDYVKRHTVIFLDLVISYLHDAR